MNVTRKVHGQADDDLEADEIQSLKAQLQQLTVVVQQNTTIIKNISANLSDSNKNRKK
jgi:hypothetical protein